MSNLTVDLVLDPYDYHFHEDPYPYYKRLRDEAPLYRNDELNFWALTRHADVHNGFRNSTELSNKLGVSLDPISRTPEAYRTMSFLAMMSSTSKPKRGHCWHCTPRHRHSFLPTPLVQHRAMPPCVFWTTRWFVWWPA